MGFPRATNNVDLKVLVPNSDYAGVHAAILAAFPEQTRQQAPAESIYCCLTIDGIIVDFLLTLPDKEELIIERAVRRELDVFCLDLFAGGFNHSKGYSRTRLGLAGY